MFVSIQSKIGLAIGVLLGALGTSATLLAADASGLQSVIIQGPDVGSVTSAVESVGGQLTQELGFIQAVGARLSANQRLALAGDPAVQHVFDDQRLVPAAQMARQQVPQQSAKVRPLRLHDLPGTGATIAVIDSGLSEQKALGETPAGFLRLLAACSAEDRTSNTLPANGDEPARTKGASVQAPADPSLVVARAFSVNDASSYLDAIRAIEWVIANKHQYRIRALDLAFSLPRSSTRRDDPLNQAVMEAWKAKIVVVSSADTVTL